MSFRLLSLAFGVLLATNAAAQLATQTAIVGTVTDSSGSVVPGAAVTAVNVGTQDRYEAVTNEQGQYNMQFVRTGKYEITVTLAGFQTFKATGVDVGNNQVVRRDAVLQVGDLSETVAVVAEAIVLDTDNATVSETLNQRLVAEAPLSGRNVWSLAGTTPGVLGGNNSFTGAGQRALQNSLTLDGINAAANFTTQTSMRPIADAVTEVNVQTGSTSAEYGSYLGVHVNIVTKSGTNDLHGSVFEFLQDSALDARGYFEDRGTPANPRRYDQFGFQTDGPVILPKLYDGRNKTFFMMAYEGVREDETSTDIQSVFTERMRRGDFSEFRGTIRNPFTGQPYPNNQIPVSELSTHVQQVLSYIPLPNRDGTAANLVATGTENRSNNQILGRVDQNIGNKVRLYVRYNWRDEVTSGIGAIPANSSDSPQGDKNTLVAYTHTLTPRLVNDFRIGYHTVNEANLGFFLNNGLLDAGSQLGIPGYDADVRYNNPGLPIFSITGFAGVQSGNANWTQGDSTFQMSNVLAYSRGAHNMRAGFDLRRLGTQRGTFNERRGMFTFNGQITGYAPADFMLGLPQRVTTPADRIINDIISWRNGFFVNDTWQLNRKTTLNLGLRYELQLVPYTVNGNASLLNREQTAIVPETPTPGFKFHDANLKDFAPRLGVAYRATEKTVVRAGFGIYYNPNHFNNFTLLTNNPPFTNVFVYFSDPANPTLSLNNPSGPGRTGRQAEHHHAELASAERAEGPVEPRCAARALGTRRARRAVSRFSHEQPGQELLQQHAVAGARRDSRAASQPVVRRDPDVPERHDRELPRGQLHPQTGYEPRPAGHRPLHVVADSRSDGPLEQQLRPQHTGSLQSGRRLRPRLLGRSAPLRRQLRLRAAVLQNVGQPGLEVHARRLAGQRHHHDRKWSAVRRENRHGRREHRAHATATGPHRQRDEQLRRGARQLHLG